MNNVVSSRVWKWTVFLLVITVVMTLGDSSAEAARRRRGARRLRRAPVVRARKVNRIQQPRINRSLAVNNIDNRFGFGDFNFDVQGFASLPAADQGSRNGRKLKSSPEFTNGEKPVGKLIPVKVENRELPNLFKDQSGNKFALDQDRLKPVREEGGKLALGDIAAVQSDVTRQSMIEFNSPELAKRRTQ